MSMNFILADTLARIKNAQMARHEFTLVKHSNFVKSVLEVLKEEGYVGDVTEFEERKGVNLIKVDLRYYKEKPAITSISMYSKPGRRMYVSAQDLPNSRNGLGTIVVSTSQGIKADHDARARNVGGELLFEIF
ncbi:MAG: 30S ribosomal protein S8 [Alphaproteobacteria bacterium]|jgi:small subunit ribosomal protein S8|nr:30S ribosomal protein S8 [Candidatus Jidaibacter sp.]